jgi:tetratricopeptide (TPR) repeat protein
MLAGRRFHALLLHCVWACALGGSAAMAEDVVVAASASDPAARVRRTGLILDYTGAELRLRTALGTVESIPAHRVKEIQTEWLPEHRAGRAARAQGELAEAIAAFQEARARERRAWAERQIRAELAGTYLEAGRIESAGDEFLAIVARDPETMHFATMPIAWRAAPPDAALERHAAKWLTDPQSREARVLGASWLLAGPERAAASAELDRHVNATDPRIAGLAAIQLWRTKLVTARPAEIAAWRSQLESMPPEIQAAGWYVLGDLLARAPEPGDAALAYLRVPLVFREQRAMAADALLAAAGQLERMGQRDEAAGLYREIVRDFGHLPLAAEAAKRIK